MSEAVDFRGWERFPWYVRRESTPDGEAFRSMSRLLYTRREVGSTIGPALKQLIDSAQQYVICCSFLLGGDLVSTALRRAVRRLRGHVYVITALDERSLVRSLKEEVPPADLQRNIKNFSQLTKQGVYVRGATSCHAKLCLIDDRRVLVGSANFDPNGLGENQELPSAEIALVTQNAERVRGLKALLRCIWRTGCKYEAKPDPVTYAVSRLRAEKEVDPVAPPNGDHGPIWTGFGSRSILERCQQLIRGAERHLALASYSFNRMVEQRSLLLQPILDARNRGVTVELYIRNRSKDLTELGELIDAGVIVRADRENHAKYVISDDRNAVIFSANFDGDYGLTNGVETGVTLSAAETAELVAFHRASFDATDNEVRRITKLDDLRRALPDLRDGSPFPPDTPVRLAGDMKACLLAEEIARGPCLVVRRHDGSYRLLGRNTSVVLQPAKSRWNVSEQRGRSFGEPTLVSLLATPEAERPPTWRPAAVRFVR